MTVLRTQLAALISVNQNLKNRIVDQIRFQQLNMISELSHEELLEAIYNEHFVDPRKMTNEQLADEELMMCVPTWNLAQAAADRDWLSE